ncbi:hypothetical protein WJX72_005964 [[Myrmecia] bisecta]|uniref:Spermatogenesis-associated protein 20-like TRX domain-containing protein n=1 Tax=[Myrmecia] bisecta TaxID=41462 RepID=A0AAW1PLD6_9CHLO
MTTHTNRLTKETSPYLLQHQHNPVDWYPWSDDAFAKARREDKPIFLSVGYSTCHWCHVMEHESFENEQIAAILNKYFVSIKVDREERPDVDKQYMTYVQATGSGGGWPMSVWLTPDLQPFMGGTYFPPEDKYGRMGFASVLKRVAEVWARNKEDLKKQGADTMEQLAELTRSQGSQEALSNAAAIKAMARCAEQLASRHDQERGGFGSAPKFPRPAEINLLLREHLRTRKLDQDIDTIRAAQGSPLHMAVTTLDHMAAGGIYDHVGGGFHRYSVDEYWHVPHFEKMLYDNPQLASTFLDAFKATGDVRYARIARGILDYLVRDMRHPDGGFHSAEDADSLDPALGKKIEGAFYLWTEAEIDDVLGPERAAVFKPHYYVKAEGNCDLSPRSDPHHEFTGKNCLIQKQSLADTAQSAGMSEVEAERVLAESREMLAARRALRPRPHLDDKVVTGWNGMAIGALATASQALQAEQPPISRSFPVEGRNPREYLDIAIKAAEWVQSKLWDANNKKLLRSFRGTPSGVSAFADDYAYLIAGLLELYGASGQTRWLVWARELQQTMDTLFWDDTSGGYYSNSGQDSSILLRMKEDYDGAEPAASSIAAGNLSRLGALSGAEQARTYEERAAAVAAAFGERLEEMPLALPQMCCSLYLQALGHLRQVIVAGRSQSPDTQALLAAAHSVFAPEKVVIAIDPDDEEATAFWQTLNPEALGMAAAAKDKGQAVAFICQNFTCKAPTSDPATVQQILAEPRATIARAPKPAAVPFRLRSSR